MAGIPKDAGSCPKCGTNASSVIEETDRGRLDGAVICFRCGKFGVEGIDDQEDFALGW